MFGIKLETNSGVSLTRQLCEQLRTLIQLGKMTGNERLPSTRKLAGELGVSRNIVIDVYEQLIAEGYLESRTGSGTYVTWNLEQGEPVYDRNTWQSIPVSVSNDSKRDIIEFAYGTPELRMFPRNSWSRCLKNAIMDINEEYLDYDDIFGFFELRSVLSEYLLRTKGIRCDEEQIIIVSGSSEGFVLCAKVFLEICNSIYIEDPSVEFTKDIFKMMGYKINCLEVDSNGARPESLQKEKEVKLALLTPSHQFPTGSILPIKRRLQMIEIAEKNSAFIIEDDYDSEFRFKGLPIQPLQVLSPSRVIYTGTFSKNMAPSLRLGYLIVPRELISRFKRVKVRLNMRTSTIEQKAMAEFIRTGCLERHIYRMKNIYSKRRAFLSSMVREYYGNNAAILGDEAGMHIKVEFMQQAFNYIDWHKSIEYGVEIDSIENFCIHKGNNRNKIILGYGNLDMQEIEEGVKRLYRFTSSYLKQYYNV